MSKFRAPSDHELAQAQLVHDLLEGAASERPTDEDLLDEMLRDEQTRGHEALLQLSDLPAPRMSPGFEARLAARLERRRQVPSKKRTVALAALLAAWSFLGILATAEILGQVEWQGGVPAGVGGAILVLLLLTPPVTGFVFTALLRAMRRPSFVGV